MDRDINRKLLDFIDASPNAFFAVKNMADEMSAAGMIRLYEGEKWELKAGQGYFVTRNDSAVVAFKIPEGDWGGFQIMASHCDSPSFKIKPNAEVVVESRYVKLNTEKYGGMLMAPWLDRPLSVAGRIIVKNGNELETRLVNIDRDLIIIPNLAIHMNRNANDGHVYNAQTDMLPLFACVAPEGEHKPDIIELAAREAGVDPGAVIDSDLYLYDRMKGSMLGFDQEFIACGRLDDLQCVFAGFKGFMDTEPKGSVAVHCVFDNEEVGSETKQGAGADLLRSVLTRISRCLGRDEEEYLMSLASSFMVSADNAHAVHPAQTDRTDMTNRPFLNEGIVIKYNANQKYTTDAVSAAVIKELCVLADIPFQTFVNRSDMPGGSTLGNIAQRQVSVNTVDIGLPQLSMHSAYETAGAKDTKYLVKLAKTLFSTAVKGKGDGNYRIVK